MAGLLSAQNISNISLTNSMAILTHKLVAKYPNEVEFSTVGIYDSEADAKRQQARWEACFTQTEFKVVPNR